MKTILIASITLNVLLTGALIYLYRTEDKRRLKREFKSQASARNEFTRMADIPRKVAESIPDAPPVYVGTRFH